MQTLVAVLLTAFFAPITVIFSNDLQFNELTDYYIEFELLNEVEIDEASWRLVGAETRFDMTELHEPERCFVQLQMVESHEEVLYEEPFQNVPVGEFEIYFTGSWMLAREVEEVLRETLCLSHQ